MLSWILVHVIPWWPVWFWPTLSAVSLLVYSVPTVLDRVPGFNVNAELLRLASIAGIVLGIFMWGGASVSAVYKKEIKEQKEEIKILKEKANQVNTVIVEKIVYKDKIIKEQAEVITKYVDRVVTVYDTKFAPGAACEIPKPFINALNAGASGNINDLSKLLDSVDSTATKGDAK